MAARSPSEEGRDDHDAEHGAGEPRATVTRPWAGPSEKVQGWHRDRLALVYVRQSTPQQVHDHQESTRLQYGLTSRARELG